MNNVTPFRKPGGNSWAADARARGQGTACAARQEFPEQRTFHFWRGASSHRYVHIVHNLLECPETGATNYILVGVDACGKRVPLRIACTTSRHNSENLAEIRHHAARLGASEVHLHLLADTAHEQTIVQWDLQAAGYGALTPEGDSESVDRSTGAPLFLSSRRTFQ